MKKILSITLMLITALTISAQINTNFWGLTLGKSTKQEVKRVLEKKGYNYDVGDNSFILIPSNGIEFEGINWPIVSISFYNNTFYDISFVCDKSNTNIKQLYDNLSKKLYKKYRAYYKYQEDELIEYKDKKTTIDLMYFDNRTGFGISYSNTLLLEKSLAE